MSELVGLCVGRDFGDRLGTVSVRLIEHSGMVSLTVQDDARTTHTVAAVDDKRNGFGLVRRLATQFRGAVDVHENGGTVVTVRFPINSDESAIKNR